MKEQERTENMIADLEIVNEKEESRALELKHPAVPATLDEIASLKANRAIEVIEARVGILVTLRRASLAMTHPEDWLLFKDREGRQVGYLQDVGCDRVRDLYGIEIFDVTDPVRYEDEEQEGEFFYIITGSGRCSMTKQTIERIQGGRASTEDFVKEKSGMVKQLDVMKAARANLDGGITRELAGLKAVPVEELRQAWKGSHKTVDHCRLGKGFGSGAERAGAAEASGVTPPECPTHGAMRLIPAGKSKAGNPYPGFYGCSNRKCKTPTVKLKEWQESQAKVGSSGIPQEKIDAIERMKEDPKAKEIIGTDGKNLVEYLDSLILEDLTEEDVTLILAQCKARLEEHRRQKEEEK